MTYEILIIRTFPGQRRDGSLGNRYEVVFTSPGIIDRDSVTVDDIDPTTVDKLVKEKIAQHEAIRKLGKL